jgi:phosphatidylserine/phosphatidylglycerophosphate/cardiolipin synthase-like enzyme
MAFDLKPSSCEAAAAAALAAGVDLRAFVLPADASARAYGDSYVYDVQALAAFVGRLGSSSSAQQQQQLQLLLLEAADGAHWLEDTGAASSRLLHAVRSANRCDYICSMIAYPSSTLWHPVDRFCVQEESACELMQQAQTSAGVLMCSSSLSTVQ